MEKETRRVNLNVPIETYIEYKKVLLEKNTYATYDIIKHMEKTISDHKKNNS